MAITVMAGCVSKSMHPIALIFLSIHLDQMAVGTWHVWADQLLKKKDQKDWVNRFTSPPSRAFIASLHNNR